MKIKNQMPILVPKNMRCRWDMNWMDLVVLGLCLYLIVNQNAKNSKVVLTNMKLNITGIQKLWQNNDATQMPTLSHIELNTSKSVLMSFHIKR
jgi:hypothetical protein